ncbi:MAG: MoaF N-terminal domain-containing protein [Novosphingobium sp.]|nr:MoaF N-terminal domain-containing protein [Novosphingobium sp.]MBO9603008.1 MoaF N-terminal domain-containing protein [Novosphingobium sp.]
MPGPAYPAVENYRFDWSALDEATIRAALDKVAAAGPQCASGLDGSLAGRTMRIVADGGPYGAGPTLAYRFESGGRLTLSENGGAEIGAGYGALRLGPIAFFAHLIPGTLRGYAVALDEASGLVTVIELWFAGYDKRKREVMRSVSFGYAGDMPVSEERHKFSNRVEGKGFYWKQDGGAETLEYYPSIAYTHWVELTRMNKKQGYSAPADYIQLSETYDLYTRTECEFSGIFQAHVVDLNRAQQVGLRIGFNAADELEFYLFRGEGEWLGQIAKFEQFGDQVAGPMLPRPGPGQSAAIDATAKGARAVYRPLETMPKMSKAAVAAAVKANTLVFAKRTGAGDGAAGMAGNSLPSSGGLAGRNATIRYDGGPVMQYRFDGPEELSWRRDGKGDWTTARYRAWESVPGVFLFGHVLEGMPDYDGHIVCADFESGKATCYNGYLNTPYFANEAGARTLFGKLESEGVPDPGNARHTYTSEMLGRAITYNYSPGLTSMHLYSTPKTTSWIIFTPQGSGGLEWCGSGAQVKIRDGLYFLYWIEEACNGTLGTILINLRTMHDAGIGYHCGTEGLSMSQVGAQCRHAGRFDVERFFADIV